jgi:DNA-binding NtrC family response regulator
MNVTSPWALLASDCTTLPDLRCVLALAGYQVQNVYSVDAANEAIAERTPDLMVVGPFRNTGGVYTLLRTLHQLDADLVVVSTDVDTIAFAERFQMRVRTPAQKAYFDTPWLRSVALN